MAGGSPASSRNLRFRSAKQSCRKMHGMRKIFDFRGVKIENIGNA